MSRAVVATPGREVVERHAECLGEPVRAVETQLARTLAALDAADLADAERGAALELVLTPAALAAQLLHASRDISAEPHRLAIMATASGAPQLSGGAVS